MPKTFADRLREMREKRGMTQAELAHAAGYDSRAMISLLERGRQPSRKAIERLAPALDVTIEWLWLGKSATEDEK